MVIQLRENSTPLRSIHKLMGFLSVSCILVARFIGYTQANGNLHIKFVGRAWGYIHMHGSIYIANPEVDMCFQNGDPTVEEFDTS